jgi:hypothetical protein
MKKGLTELVFILGQSGSIGGLESDTIGSGRDPKTLSDAISYNERIFWRMGCMETELTGECYLTFLKCGASVLCRPGRKTYNYSQ